MKKYILNKIYSKYLKVWAIAVILSVSNTTYKNKQ